MAKQLASRTLRWLLTFDGGQRSHIDNIFVVEDRTADTTFKSNGKESSNKKTNEKEVKPHFSVREKQSTSTSEQKKRSNDLLEVLLQPSCYHYKRIAHYHKTKCKQKIRERSLQVPLSLITLMDGYTLVQWYFGEVQNKSVLILC